MSPQEKLFECNFSNFDPTELGGALIGTAFANIGQGKNKIAKAQAEAIKNDSIIKAERAKQTPQMLTIGVIGVVIAIAAFILLKK